MPAELHQVLYTRLSALSKVQPTESQKNSSAILFVNSVCSSPAHNTFLPIACRSKNQWLYKQEKYM
jgi:hypothetical protein